MLGYLSPRSKHRKPLACKAQLVLHSLGRTSEMRCYIGGAEVLAVEENHGRSHPWRERLKGSTPIEQRGIRFPPAFNRRLPRAS